MDYKAYTLMAILLLGSLALVVPIGTTYATTNATDAATTDGTEVPAMNATEGEWTPFDLTVEDQTFPIEYMITGGGSVENMTIQSENQTLEVTISSEESNGTLSLRLPREVIDSQTDEGSDADFAAFIDNAEFTEPSEMEAGNDTRTLLIGFPEGAESVEIIGTSVIPEFSTIAIVVLAVAIVGIIVATTRHGRFNFNPRM